MDCRRAMALVLGLLCGSLGCAHDNNVKVAVKDEPPPADIRKEPDEPKRDPKPSTCVALGGFNERAAADPRCSPAQQEQYLDRARKAYQQALRLDPNNLPAMTSLARLYVHMSDHEHAIATYKQALESHPKDAALWHELGICYAQTRQWEPAIDNLRHAVQLDPEQRLYNHSLGFCLARSGRYEESFTAFAKLEGAASAHYNVARMLHHMNQDELSIQHLRQALELKPDLTPARDLLAKLELPVSELPVSESAGPDLPVDGGELN
jgi:tetratricopeptide (TPR) repeat protein